MKTDKAKSDVSLGMQVHEHLVSLGLETPMVMDGAYPQNYETRKALIEEHYTEIMKVLHLDLTDDSLAETPARIAKMYLNDIFWGLDYANFPKITLVENKMKYDEMILERNVLVHSTCEHHILPIMGVAHVGYTPSDKVPGLSKINRVVEFFSRRPQIQERLTAQIHATLTFLLDTDNVAVTIEAEHLCVKTRGVEDPCSDTVTTKLGGAFKADAKTRAEFYAMISGSSNRQR